MLPHDFPCWQTVYDYFQRWQRTGAWEQLNQTLRERVRVAAGREPIPSAGIIDSRLSKDYERLPQTNESIIYAAMIRLMLKRLASNSQTFPIT